LKHPQKQVDEWDVPLSKVKRGFWIAKWTESHLI